ncbi:MAG TPA: 50S ribosomal protein L10 [Actinomycetota bacterium]
MPTHEPNTRKVERVAELKVRIEGSDALLLTEYRGLTVSEISELRRSLAEGGTSFAVVKNTLMRRAAQDAGIEDLDTLLDGPSAVAFVEGDPVAAAKSVVDVSKKFPSLILKGGYMDGKLLSADDAKALASLESREAMLSKIAGLMKSEMSKAAALFVGAQSKFLSVLEAYKDTLPAAAEPAAEEPVASAEATEATTDEPITDPAEPVSAEAEPAPATVETADAPSDDHEGES